MKVIGYTKLLLVKPIWPAIVMSGSPLKVVPETEQLDGVMVIWVPNVPSPELSRVPLMSPETDMVPPPEQGPVYDNGRLQLWPVEVGVQPLEEVSG
jgi:hypothetical protein